MAHKTIYRRIQEQREGREEGPYKEKREYENLRMKEMEEYRNINGSRILYRMVNRNRKVFKPRITMCRDIVAML
jgi:hypothetical protein